MAIEGSSGHMGYEQAQARAALPTIAQSTADTHSEAVTTNEYLKDVKSELNIQGRAIIQLAVSFRKFFEWNKEHASALMNSQALEDTATTGSKVDKKSKGESEKIKGLDLSGLSVLPTIMAVAMGTIGGLFIGVTKYIKTWARVFVPGIVEAFDDFKGKLITSLDDFAKGIKATIQNSRKRFARTWTTMIDDMGRFFGKQFARVKTFFSVADDGKIAKLITAINRRFKGFVNMLKDARDLFKLLWQSSIGKILAKIKSGGSIIKNLMFKFNKFGRIIGSVARLVGKLFLPLTIVMTAFDTIQGAIDGFNKDGWWGMIRGGITALFDSLVAMPLDLLKDGAEWLARKLGWNATADILGSFSFREIFDKVIGELFVQVKKLVDGLMGIWNFVSDPETTWKDILFAGLDGILSWYDLIFLPVTGLLKWLMGKFVWDDAEAEKKHDFSFTDMVGDLALKGGEWLGEQIVKVWDDIKAWFTDSFGKVLDMLPSFQDIKNTLMSALPDILRPDSEDEPEKLDKPDNGPEEKLESFIIKSEKRHKEVSEAIGELQARIARSNSGKDEYWGNDARGRKVSAAYITELQKEIAEINAALAAVQPAIVNNNNNYIDSSSHQSSTGTAVTYQPGSWESKYTGANPMSGGGGW